MDNYDNIDVLIGSDYYWDIITGEVARGDDKLVKPYDFMDSQNQATELANSLNWFWDIESAGITEPSSKVNEDEQFLRFIKFDKDEGRYEVDLPWREQTCKQSDNFDLCVTRLNCLEELLKKDEELLQEYDSIFKAQLEAGIIELVPKDEEDFEGAHFLPHHGALREDRETTKMRIVFDGSARADKNTYSLNDCLENGPNLTPHVFEVLAKFRSYPNVEEERLEIVQYRFRRLVFGLTSSLAILNGTIQHHLSHYKEPEPQVSELPANSLYVDDFPGGASDDEPAIHVYQRTKAIMKEGGFNLRKWKTNSSIVRQRISEEMKEEDDKSEVKILGLNWDTMSDELRFEFVSVMEYLNSLPPTKRSVLKLSAKLFDPLAKLNIPRCYFVREKKPVCRQLHEFSDASEQAIAVVVYLRTVYEAGDVDVRLIASKTKVAPPKKQSIPILELMGAYILSKLVDTVFNAFKLLPFEVDVYYWVD
ncbi:uncharacterized protein [Porites lutea]|uniref:uncharacterized protein n=1 Tax=Porites lutea TaxID=51062 RepID=UPI003CC657DE